ncbi:MAG: NTP transferase domain-containing protein [Chitinophagales bacterium]|nr:NTP transferase domain-containing protein [Chitinophagales bacterium]
MHAMIFAAGLGTRFKPWTDYHPKALALVNGQSLLQRNIAYLRQYGIQQVIVNVHHFSQQIIEAVNEQKGWGSEVFISDESDKLLETGGGLQRAQPLFPEGQPFLTCNADFLTDLDIHQLIRFHQEKKAQISFGVTSRKSSRNLLFDETGRLRGWENTQTGETRPAKLPIPRNELKGLAYSCVVVFEYEVFRLMKDKGFEGKFSLIDVYLALAEEQVIMGYDHTGDRLVDVGKPESVAVAEAMFP